MMEDKNRNIRQVTITIDGGFYRVDILPKDAMFFHSEFFDTLIEAQNKLKEVGLTDWEINQITVHDHGRRRLMKYEYKETDYFLGINEAIKNKILGYVSKVVDEYFEAYDVYKDDSENEKYPGEPNDLYKEFEYAIEEHVLPRIVNGID